MFIFYNSASNVTLAVPFKYKEETPPAVKPA